MSLNNMVQCSRGHQHYGKNGAAGIILYRYRDDGQVEMLLSQRSANVDHPNTWCTIGGLVNDGEQTFQAAIREMQEETGYLIRQSNIALTGAAQDNHGGWTYTTYFATPNHNVKIPDAFKLQTSEITQVRWITRKELGHYPLHPSFLDHTVRLMNTMLQRDYDPATGAFCPTVNFTSILPKRWTQE
ncbi:uncharacterized protein F4822DRAFT_378431 [Hypoxylon trugodes]|uniref:uncharacterized protein n=1 Tax=Hypoxylon trugodes TaxID=326681 RepID=UPI002198E8CC|nr:uncharacterized protein F4822DRAFT_378431 [Hypoxylon trugodes]KAI1384952.1 hypothetical protein F4822DRAFT_378431 [Hypoxylon trugodes]